MFEKLLEKTIKVRRVSEKGEDIFKAVSKKEPRAVKYAEEKKFVKVKVIRRYKAILAAAEKFEGTNHKYLTWEYYLEGGCQGFASTMAIVRNNNKYDLYDHENSESEPMESGRSAVGLVKKIIDLDIANSMDDPDEDDGCIKNGKPKITNQAPEFLEGLEHGGEY